MLNVIYTYIYMLHVKFTLFNLKVICQCTGRYHQAAGGQGCDEAGRGGGGECGAAEQPEPVDAAWRSSGIHYSSCKAERGCKHMSTTIFRVVLFPLLSFSAIQDGFLLYMHAFCFLCVRDYVECISEYCKMEKFYDV